MARQTDALRWPVAALNAKLVRLLVASLLLVTALPALADDESDFRAKPTAALAEKIARAALARDQVGKAMNWTERVSQTPGATLAQLNWAIKMRTDLRWRLNDAHIAAVQLRVSPASADVIIDGVQVPFHTGMHTLWLPEGVHQAEVIALDHATQTQSIGARLGEREVYEITLEYSKPPVLQVHMIPDGEVWLNGAPLGPSTKVRFVVGSGRHLIELRAPGYLSWQQEMTLKTGDVKFLDVQLKPNVPPPDPELAHRAHQVDRPLLPSEVSQQRDRVFNHIEVSGSKLDKSMGTHAAADAASPESQRKAREQEVAKSKAAPKPDEPVEVAGKAREAAPAEQPRVTERPREEARAEKPREVAERPVQRVPDRIEPDTGVTEPATPSGPWFSRTTKGWLYGGAGLAAVGAGLVLAYMGTQDAETANQEPRGAKTYADDYNAAAGKTYVGYAAAGLGVVGVGVGSYYLFGNGGLGRKGKGWVVTTLGALTAAAGGWLVMDAVTLASNTDTTLTPSNPEYTRRFDLAERNRWIGIGVAGAGAVLVGTGLALVLSAPSSSAQQEPLPSPVQRPALAWQLQPWIGGTATGASLAVGW